MAEDEWGAFNMDPAPSSSGGDDPWGAFKMDPPPEQRMPRRREEEPEAEGMFATAGRAFAHEAPAVVAGAAGALYGGAAGSAAGPVGTIGGALAGGIAGGYAGAAVGEAAFQAVGVDDAVQRAINAKTNPWSAAAGQAAAQILGFGAGTASTAARLGGAGIGAALEGGSQLYEGEFDPARLATQTAAGAAFTRPYSWGTKIEQAGARAGEDIATGYRSRQAEKFVGPTQPEGPPEFQGPRQPYGPPEQYGPRQEPDLDYHGSGNPKSSGGVSESPMPPPKDPDIGLARDNKVTEDDGRGYAKDVRPKLDDGSSQVHVTNTDPDLQHVLDSRAAEEYGPNQPQGPRQPEGPPEMQGPRQPFGPPEQQGPRQPPPVAEPPQGMPPAQEPTPPTGPTKRPAKGVDPNSLNALDYLTTQGGLKADEFGELASIRGGGGNYNYPQGGALFRKEGGMTLDQARQKLVDAGFINDEGARLGDRPSTSSVNDALEIIRGGLEDPPKHTYTMGNEGRQSTREKARLADENLEHNYRQVDDFLDEVGVTHPEPGLRDRMVKLMQKEGIDAETAHDRVMEEPAPKPTYEPGVEGKDQGVMPGFEQATQKTMTQRAADAPLRAKANQDFGGGDGLFGEGRLADTPDELFAERKVLERGRSGRPIRTEPLPIGSEEGIIKAGLEKVENTPRPEIDAERTTEAMARKGMSKEEMAAAAKLAEGVPVTKVEPSRRLQGKKLTSEDLVAGERGDIAPPVSQKIGDVEAGQPTSTASARKNGEYGYKAVVTDADGRTKIPNPKNFNTREEALAYAQKFIDANNERPKGVRTEKVDVLAGTPPKTEADLAREGGKQPAFVGAQSRARTAEELAQPYPLADMLEGKHVPAYSKMLKDKAEGGDLLRRATAAFDAAVQKIKAAGYNPGDFAIRNIPELNDANKTIQEIGGSVSRLVSGVSKKNVDGARTANDLLQLRQTLGEANRPYAEKRAEIDASIAKQKQAEADYAAKAPEREAVQKQHSTNMEEALNSIERAVEAGNRGDVMKAAKAAKDVLDGVPKEVKALDKDYWGQFNATIKNMTKKDYETATQQAAREGDANAQKILDTGVDETAKKTDPINAASDKILKDMGITPDEKGGVRAAPALDPALANKMLNQPRVLREEAVKRGITADELKAQAKEAVKTPAAPGTPSPLSPTGGQAIPPNVGAAVRQGGAGGLAPTPPAGGGPPPPPPPGGGGGGPNQPNAGHVPPQQRGWFSELWRDVQRKVGAHMLGPEAMEARRLIRGAYGENYRVAEQTAAMLKDHQDTIRAMDPADRAALINQMQGGNHFPNFVPTAEQKALMQTHERVVQEWEAKLRSLPEADKMNFIDHYMAGMYENPTAAPNMFAGAGKRGGAGSTKGKVYATYEDAKAAGLIPKSDDPIEITTRYINSIKDFVASRQVLDRAELGGTIGYFKATQNVGATGSPTPLQKGGPPPGWKQLNGVEKNGKSGYAPEDFADAYNNFYDKGFGKTDKSRGVYEAVRNSTNAWTQLELGINAYHMFTMANEAVISDVAGALKKAFTGDFAGAGESLKSAPMAWRNRYVEGKAFQKEYLDPNSTNPIASILAEANARPIGRGHAADYTFQDRGSFINKWDKNSIQSELNNALKEIQGDFANAQGVGQKGMAALRNAGRALQTVSAPIFDKYIPALKAGALHSMMKDYHAAMLKENPNFDMINNPADRRTAVNAAMKMVDSVDNRFGEMIHDNMFMNATLKQSAQVAMRSFSWAIGSMKEIGGGSAAVGKNLVHLARTGENRFSMTHPEWDPRMAYAIAFPFVISAVSTIYQGLLGSHDLPKDWRDLYAPRTGGVVPGVGGRGEVPEHVLMPGYQKDVMGWTHHPVQEAYNKLGGLPQTAIEQITGKDWRGQPIVRPNASLPEMASDRMGHLFSKLGPISVKNMTKGSEPGTEIPAWQKALGFRAPGAYIQDPEGLDRAMNFKEKRDWKAKEKRERKIELRQNPGG